MKANTATGTFPTTSWTGLRRAAVDRDELGVLLEAYWAPVYAFIRRKGYDRPTAADLTQAFVARIVERPTLLINARRERGRFRTYLLAALRRHLIDIHRQEVGRAGSRPRVVALSEPVMLDAAEPDDTDDPALAYDRQWATTALNLAMELVEAHYREREPLPHWAIYEARILRPACSGCEPIDFARLAATHRVSETEAYAMLNTVKRKVRNELSRVVEASLDDPAELSSELAELRRVLTFDVD